MNELPDGWTLPKIGGVFEVNPRKTHGVAADPGLEVTFLPMQAVTEENANLDPSDHRTIGSMDGKSYRYFEEGDLLVAKITPSMENGKATVARGLKNGIGFGSTEFHVLRPGPDVLPEYGLWFVLQRSFRADAARNMTGTAGQLRVPAEYLRQRPIPLPPLEEQRRIVETIEDLFSRIERGADQCTGVVRRAIALRKSIQISTFAELGPIRRLDSVAEVISGNTPKGLESVPAGEIPFFKVGDMNSSSRMMTKARTYLDQGAVSRLKVHVRPAGTVIFPKRGGAIATNKKRMLSVPSAFDLNTMGVVPGPDLLAEYLYCWFDTIDLGSLSDGSNVPQINHGDIRPLLLPVPDLQIQRVVVQTMVAQVDRAESVAAQLAATVRRTDALRSAILAAAFSGRLTSKETISV